MNLIIRKEYNNWLTILEDLVKGKVELSDEQIYQIQKSATNWPTCACGQLCQNLPRFGDGQPVDTILTNLGLEFNRQVANRCWDDALHTFKKIETRSSLLIDTANKKSSLLAAKAKLEKELAELG